MVLNSAMSPTTKFLLRVFHFWRSCNDYVLYLSPSSSTIQIRSQELHRWWHDYLWFHCQSVSWCNGWKLPGSFIISTVRGPEFRIPSISVINLRRDLSFRPFQCVFSKDSRIACVERISLSQTPPMWLANGGFLSHFIQSPPIPSMKDRILLSFISEYAFFSSFSALMELRPLNRLILHVHV